MADIKVFFHKIDLDGKCSAAIVKRKYPDCELIGFDYGEGQLDFSNLERGETFFVVDCYLGLSEMANLHGFGKLIWIDHHKTAIEEVENSRLRGEFKGIREIGKAACELTWEYLFPDEPMPEAVRLLGRYDVWDKSDKFDWLHKILPFQMGMRLIDAHAGNTNYWNDIFMNSFQCVDNNIEEGRTVLIYENQRNQTYAKEMAFKVEFEGHKTWAINKALSNSKIFETIENVEERPLWILFSYKAKIWRYSIYSAPDSGLDVSKIAAKYGGGGHAGAAGFQSDKYLLTETII